MATMVWQNKKSLPPLTAPMVIRERKAEIGESSEERECERVTPIHTIGPCLTFTFTYEVL